mgnify:CR=1 FL=1
MFEEIVVTLINLCCMPLRIGGHKMELSVIVENYLKSVGGLQCKICDEWDDKDRFVGPICCDCNDEIEEVIAQAEDW